MAVIKSTFAFMLFLTFVFYCSLVQGAVLEADRADVLYHSYDGGGMKIEIGRAHV